MPRIKPPEFEDRPAVAESDPGDRFWPGQPCSVSFKTVSVLSGSFVALFGLSSASLFSFEELNSAQYGTAGLFCVLTYLFLQIGGVYHQRQGARAPRATAYFWLLALHPLWGLPAGWALTEVITRFWLAVLPRFNS